MYEIRVESVIAAPLEAVFEAVTDYERFFSGPQFQYARITTPGRASENGLGAIREICLSSFVFREEIVRFEPPTRFDYRIVSVTSKRGRAMPISHELGWIELTPTEEGVHLSWRSRFTVPIPIIGGGLAWLMGARAAAVFRQLVRRSKVELEAGHGGVG